MGKVRATKNISKIMVVTIPTVLWWRAGALSDHGGRQRDEGVRQSPDIFRGAVICCEFGRRNARNGGCAGGDWRKEGRFWGMW